MSSVTQEEANARFLEASRNLKGATGPGQRAAAENELLEATITVLRVARGESVKRRKALVIDVGEGPDNAEMDNLRQQNTRLQGEIGALKGTIENMRLQADQNANARQRIQELEQELDGKIAELETLQMRIGQEAATKDRISDAEDAFDVFDHEVLKAYAGSRINLPTFSAGDVFYGISDLEFQGGVILEPVPKYSMFYRRVSSTEFDAVVGKTRKRVSITNLLKFPDELQMVKDFSEYIAKNDKGQNDAPGQDALGEDPPEEDASEQSGIFGDQWFEEASNLADEIFKPLAEKNADRGGSVQDELGDTKVTVATFLDLYATSANKLLYKDFHVKLLFFVFTKLATGKEQPLDNAIPGMANVSWEAKMKGVRGGPEYGSLEKKSAVSAMDGLPAMNASIATLFLQHIDELLIDNTDAGNVMEASYKSAFNDETVSTIDLGRKEVLKIPETVSTDEQLGYVAVSAVKDLYGKYLKDRRDKTAIPLLTKYLFNSPLPARFGPGSTLFTKFGKRPTYKSAGGTVKYITSHAPMGTAIEHAVDGPGSVVFAVEAGDGQALTRALAQCIAKDDDEPALRGLMEAAKTGATSLLPVFASARALLLDSDWEAAENEARDETTKELIRNIAQHDREPAVSEVSLPKIFKKPNLPSFKRKQSTIQGALKKLANKYPSSPIGALAGKLAENETLAETTQPVTVIIPSGGNLGLSGDDVLSVVALGKLDGPSALFQGNKKIPTLAPGDDSPSGPVIELIPVKTGFLKKTIAYDMKYGKNGNTVRVGVDGKVWAGGKRSKHPFTIIIVDPVSKKGALRTGEEEAGGSPADLAGMVSSVSGAIAAAASDGEAWEAVNLGHEWLNREELLREEKPSGFLEGAEWDEAMRSLREALTEREYDTLDSEAWQHAAALRERL